MKQTLTTSKAINLLLQDKNANRTYEESREIIEYYENYEEQTGEEIEIDVVGIRCERSSYTMEELYNAYDHDGFYEENEDFAGFIEHLSQSTIVIEIEDSILIMDF